jgi:anti-anti-sigma factor
VNEYQISRDGAQSRVVLREKLTAADVPVLQPLLKEEVSAGAHEIVFDLEHTISLDSTGIGLLIATNNSIAATQGVIRLINVSPDVYMLLRNMRLVERLHAVAAEKGEPNG